MSSLKNELFALLSSKPEKLEKGKIKKRISEVKKEIRENPEKRAFGLNKELAQLKTDLERAKKPDSVYFDFGGAEGVSVKRSYLERLKDPVGYVNGLYGRKMYNRGLKALENGEYGTARSIEALMERQSAGSINKYASDLGKQIQLSKDARRTWQPDEFEESLDDFWENYDQQEKEGKKYTEVVRRSADGNSIRIDLI